LTEFNIKSLLDGAKGIKGTNSAVRTCMAVTMVLPTRAVELEHPTFESNSRQFRLRLQLRL